MNKNGIETNWDISGEVIDEFPYDTFLAVTEYCINSEHEDSIINYSFEENDTWLYFEVREISLDTKNEDVIQRYITENEKEKHIGTYEEVKGECPDETPAAMMKDCVNKNLDDKNKNDLNEVNEIGVDGEEGERNQV